MDGELFVGLVGYVLTVALWIVMVIVYIVTEIKERRSARED